MHGINFVWNQTNNYIVIIQLCKIFEKCEVVEIIRLARCVETSGLCDVPSINNFAF